MSALVAASLLAGATSAQATTFSVTTTSDRVPQANACLPIHLSCTLREATIAANAAATNDIISIPGGTYSLRIENGIGGPEDASARGDLDIVANGTLAITGAGARSTIINGNSIDRVLDVHQKVGLDISGLTIAGGVTTLSGGGVQIDGSGASPPATVTLTDATVKGNRAALGAGIYATNNSDLTLTTSTVSGNVATKAGGGIDNDPGGGSATLSLVKSTVAGNFQTDTQPVSLIDYGGGGVANGGTTTLDHATISNNYARAGGGGIQRTAGTVSTKSSIVSGNFSPTATLTNCDAGITSNGFNLEQGTTCGLTMGSDVHADPKLTPLGDFGGPTDTMMPKPGSAAIGNADTSGCPGTDQRGVVRPQGIGCDIGSDETETTDVSLSMTDSPDPVQNGSTLRYTITVHNIGAQAAHGVRVVDTLPSGVTPQSDVPSQGSCSGGQTRTCSLGNIAAASTATVQIDVQATSIGSVSNTATVSIANIETNAANNSATATTSIGLASGRCANILRGTSGGNTLNGSPKGDAISGLGGNDTLSGFGGQDCLYGGKGADRLFGGSGDDFLYGGKGNDFLKGGTGNDRFRGEGGDDQIVANDGRSESIDCGSGFDRALVDQSDHVKNCEVVTRQ